MALLITWLKVREGSRIQQSELVCTFLEKISIERNRSKLYLKVIYYCEEVLYLKIGLYHSPLNFSKLKHWI